jgi:membrane protease YdiL (CAAX protease family)
MPQPPDDPVLTAFAVGTMLLSTAIGVYLLVKRQWGPLLSYGPRRPVPWGSAAAILAVMFMLLALFAPNDGQSSPVQQENAREQQENTDAAHIAVQLLSAMVPEVLLVGGVLFLIAVYFSATPPDLGFPANLGELSHDALIGVVAGLAALAPIHMLQLLLAYLTRMNEGSGHPLVKLLVDGKPDLIVMLLAAFAVVVVAPVCEEITFRLLLQGWLEKWEVQQLGWRDKPLPEINDGSDVQIPIADSMTNDEARMTNEEISASDHSSFTPPPPRGAAGFPFGWLPIAISSLLFGLAHYGYGPEPIPLFFLGLLLGYVYQRTHRIVPCIVAHALFNLFTVIVLWWMVFHGAK